MRHLRLLLKVVLLTALGVCALEGAALAEDAYIVNSISDPAVVNAVSVSPGSQVAYGVCLEAQSAVAFDIYGLSVAGETVLGLNPRAVEANADGGALVTASLGQDGYLYWVYPDGTVSVEVGIGIDPRGVAFDYVHNMALIAMGHDQKLSVVSLPDLIEVDPFTLEGGARIVAVDQARSLAIALGSANIHGPLNTIMVVDLGTGLVQYTPTNENFGGMAYSEKLGLAVLFSGKDVFVFDPEDGSPPTAAASGGSNFDSISFDPSAQAAYITSMADVFRFDLESWELKALLLPLTETAHPIAVEPYSNTALVGDGQLLHIVQLPNPVPVLSSVAPPNAPGGLETALTLTGERFVTSSTVRFGGTDIETVFVDNETLNATVPSSLMNTPGEVPVTVFNPYPAGGESNEVMFEIKLPPTINSISPSSVTYGSGGFSLHVYGSDFLSGAVINLNGQDIQTTFVNETELLAGVPGDLLSSAGAYTLFAVNPGRQTSNAAYLTVAKATSGFSNLSSPSIVQGSTPTTLSGTIKAGSLVPPGSVSVSLDGVAQSAAIDAAGNFSSSFETGQLNSGTYTITYNYPGDQNFTSAISTGTLTVYPAIVDGTSAAPLVSIHLLGGSSDVAAPDGETSAAPLVSVHLLGGSSDIAAPDGETSAAPLVSVHLLGASSDVVAPDGETSAAPLVSILLQN